MGDDPQTFQIAARNLIESIDRRDREAVEQQLRQLHDESERAARGGVRAVVGQRAKLTRVRARLTGRANQVLAAYALGYIDHDLVRLRDARTRSYGAAAGARYEQELAGVREQVWALLEQPRRPRDLAGILNCDPSQISRALRELETDGAIVTALAPPGADRRGRWFQQAPDSGHMTDGPARAA